ncbi:hypothetical protein BC751_0764 [Cecembia calidifontis]|jgi:hypothetical protein|uniref:Uncharacterized protein n=1 Tax=Cecembia calidifontis TaxID=1187080 RepID=A0A4Q7P5N1_9BACT|nr:hypothetical protein BC751_0764 [Cecembia calidifontis]
MRYVFLLMRCKKIVAQNFLEILYFTVNPADYIFFRISESEIRQEFFSLIENDGFIPISQDLSFQMVFNGF